VGFHVSNHQRWEEKPPAAGGEGKSAQGGKTKRAECKHEKNNDGSRGGGGKPERGLQLEKKPGGAHSYKNKKEEGLWAGKQSKVGTEQRWQETSVKG